MKVSQQKIHVHADYPSFEIGDEIVVAYGLDYNEKFRHLPYIAAMSDKGLVKYKKQ